MEPIKHRTIITATGATAGVTIQSGLADSVLMAYGDSLLTVMRPDIAIRAMTKSRDHQDKMRFEFPVTNTFAMTAYPHMKK